MPESTEHLEIKNLLEQKLKEWFGLGIKEYSSSGHEWDIFGITIDGVTIFIEIIWTSTKSQFSHDMNILHRADADVKLVIGSPAVLQNSDRLREFSIAVAAEINKDCYIHAEIMDGQRILEDSSYVDQYLKEKIQFLVDKAKNRLNQQASKSYFEKRKSAIFIPMVGNGDPIIQILIGPENEENIYLADSEKNDRLVSSYQPSFLSIAYPTPRREKYEFQSLSPHNHLEMYRDGFFYTYFGPLSDNNTINLDAILFVISNFIFFTTRLMKMRNITDIQRIYIELNHLGDREVIVEQFLHLQKYQFPNKSKHVFEEVFNPDLEWKKIFSLLCDICREILLEVGVGGLSKDSIRNKIKRVISNITDLRKEFRGIEVIPAIPIKELFIEEENQSS